MAPTLNSPYISVLRLYDGDGLFTYRLDMPVLSANRIINFPVLAGDDEFVFKNHAVTMSNKTFVAPVLGTPASGTLTNCTGLPATGVTNTAATLTDTQTLTNKRITPRVGSTTSSATPTINTDNVDIYKLTAQTEAITSFTTNLSGTPTDGQPLIIQITGTAARAITWGASFEESTVALPTTTVTTEMLTVGFLWNAVTSKWRCIGAC
ncbi:MAG: hypothetical protein Q8L60_10615 [Gammaproteobacteria bacterium]|nr:hypothetical protein [Gammaproteobacteria bacterium]MDP2346800.1 hypothetical protein [Gammaproteobacteria bacterium]